VTVSIIFSYKRFSWHKQQLTDMIAAGVDFLMPVFYCVLARNMSISAWQSAAAN